MTKTDLLKKLIPIMFAFFAMGAVDFVGIATNYVKVDFALSDTMANLFTSMTFFLVFDFFSTYRLADEQNRTAQNRAVEFGYYYAGFAFADI